MNGKQGEMSMVARSYWTGSVAYDERILSRVVDWQRPVADGLSEADRVEVEQQDADQ
jgi:hypothetical protein